MAITALHPTALPGRLYGDFSGKEESGGPTPVEIAVILQSIASTIFEGPILTVEYKGGTVSTATIVTGYDVNLSVTLKSDDATFNMSGTTVTAMIVTQDRTTNYTAAIIQSEAATGADWSNSLVVIEMEKADTEDIEFQGSALLEIQVAFPDTKPWFLPVELVKGNIV